MRYGATDSDWMDWAYFHGLLPDLLPVVCRPGATVHPSSVLNDYGKVPSRYTDGRTVVGFTGWTSYVARAEDVESWSGEADYGICLQTRRVRALDFDLLDHDFAAYLRECLAALDY